MAEGEVKPVPKEGAPVKKRRFFRPRPKKAPEDGQQTVQPKQKLQSKPEQAVKPKQAPKPKAEQAVKPKQSPKPKVEQAVKPKQAPKPKVEQAAKPQQASKPKAEQAAKPQQAPKPKAEQAHKPKTEQVVKAEGRSVAKPQNRPKPQQLKPATQAGARVVKTNSNFRPRKPNSPSRLTVKDISFEYLNTPEFADVYALVTKAQGYFETDKETCCAKFRIANEAIITRLVKTMQLEEAVEKNTFEQIDLLAKKIPVNMVNSNIFTEMHNIRMIGNSFVHNDDKYDPKKGATTCLIAMGKICMWLVEFEPKYKSYQRAKAATRSTFDIIKDFIKGIFKF